MAPSVPLRGAAEAPSELVLGGLPDKRVPECGHRLVGGVVFRAIRREPP